MTPEYEKPADRERERRVLDEFIRFKGPEYSYRQTAPKTRYDADLYRNGVLVAFIEIRGRNNTKNKYMTFKIDRNKIDPITVLSNARGLTGIFIVDWTDNIGYINLTEYQRVTGRKAYTLFMFGKMHRGDKGQRYSDEYVIPLKLFKTVKDKRKGNNVVIQSQV